jgi:hypothetical protein
MPGHVVLLGDSIFDNGVYVAPKPAVVDQLRHALPKGWKATLLAVDGACAADVDDQLRHLPGEATHLVLSVGGNDAINAASVFEAPARTGADAFLEMSRIRRAFDAVYRRTLDAVLAPAKPTIVCTIYDPNFPAGDEQEMSVSGLAVFNDCITREAFRRGLPVIDLRVLFTESRDYANPIEPSDRGGAKIVREIVTIVTTHDFSQKQSVIYAGRHAP